MLYYVRAWDMTGNFITVDYLYQDEAQAKFNEFVTSGKYSQVRKYLHSGRSPKIPDELIDIWKAPKSEAKTSAFSAERKAPSHQIQTWKYVTMRYFLNHCGLPHEIIPLEGNILYVLIHCATNDLRPLIESFQKKYSLYVQMDSYEDSTLLAIMEKREHAPAELAIKHKIFRANLYE